MTSAAQPAELPPLNAQARAVLDRLAAECAPTPREQGVTAVRERYRARCDQGGPHAEVLDTLSGPRVAEVRTLAVDHEGHRLTLRAYFPSLGPTNMLGAHMEHPTCEPGADRAASTECDRALPALVYLHGGGWVSGDLDTHDGLCRLLCAKVQMAVLAVDYRRAPEHPFPAAFDDALAAFRYVATHADELGIDPARIAIGGDSSGGNLAAAAAQALRHQAIRPAFQLLVYPATTMHTTSASYESLATGYGLTRDAMRWYIEQYLGGNPGLRDDHRASPLLAPSLEGCPPALVLTASHDPLRDEGEAYAAALARDGVEVRHICFPGQIHGFVQMGGWIDDGFAAILLCADALRRALC